MSAFRWLVYLEFNKNSKLLKRIQSGQWVFVLQSQKSIENTSFPNKCKLKCHDAVWARCYGGKKHQKNGKKKNNWRNVNIVWITISFIRCSHKTCDRMLDSVCFLTASLLTDCTTFNGINWMQRLRDRVYLSTTPLIFQHFNKAQKKKNLWIRWLVRCTHNECSKKW